MRNLTPHAITIRVNGTDTVIMPSGTVARVITKEEFVGTCQLTGCDIMSRTNGEVTGLPEPGIPCLVSGMVLAAVPGRRGVFAPDSGATAIRDERGQVEAVTRLIAA